MPARGRWDLCAQTHFPRITRNISMNCEGSHWAKCGGPPLMGRIPSDPHGGGDPYFADEETEAQMGRHLAQAHRGIYTLMAPGG